MFYYTMQGMFGSLLTLLQVMFTVIIVGIVMMTIFYASYLLVPVVILAVIASITYLTVRN